MTFPALLVRSLPRHTNSVGSPTNTMRIAGCVTFKITRVFWSLNRQEQGSNRALKAGGQLVCSDFFFPRFCCSTLCHIILRLATGSEWLSRAKILPTWLLLDWKQRKKNNNMQQQGHRFKCPDTFRRFVSFACYFLSFKTLGRQLMGHTHEELPQFRLAVPLKCRRRRPCENPTVCKSGTALGENCWLFSEKQGTKQLHPLAFCSSDACINIWSTYFYVRIAFVLFLGTAFA